MKKIILIGIILSLAGCAHVVSRELREQVDRWLLPADLFKEPDAFKGKLVILGGVIAGASNAKEGTYIEVVQKPLNRQGRPKDTDFSYGRFLILYEGYLETSIYTAGREITVAGEVLGKKERPMGETKYSYLLIKSKELYLFDRMRDRPIHFGVGVGVMHTF